MKKCAFALTFCAILLFTACGASATSETVGDSLVEVSADPVKLCVDIPESAVASGTDGGGALYLCDGYCITVDTLQSTAYEDAVKELTGYEADKLQIIPTKEGDIRRYDMVWHSAGEECDQMNRGTVLTDGRACYAVTAMADAENVGSLNEVWEKLFRSVSLDVG